jgi:hypothetical protein
MLTPGAAKMKRLLIFIACLTPASASAADYRQCIRVIFPHRNVMNIINLCEASLNVSWRDENGEHTSAVGPATSYNLVNFVGLPLLGKIAGASSDYRARGGFEELAH